MLSQENVAQDPYNWPTLKREDLMSLNTIQQDRDLFRVKTAQFQKRTRLHSQNLDNHDIQGPLSYQLSLAHPQNCRQQAETVDERRGEQARILKRQLGHRALMSESPPHS